MILDGVFLALREPLGEALRDARALILPVDCAGCGELDRAMCVVCRAHLRPVVTPRACDAGVTVQTSLRYEAIVRRVVLALKEEGRTDVARYLAAPMAAAIAAARAGAPAATLVRIPRGRDSYRRRGFDPLQLVLRAAGEGRARGLRSVRSTLAQKSLGVDDRSRNLVGTMVARRDLVGCDVLLVDDILTSGATLTEGARAVEAVGGRVVGAAAVAFTPRLRGIRDFPPAEDYGGAKGA